MANPRHKSYAVLRRYTMDGRNAWGTCAGRRQRVPILPSGTQPALVPFGRSDLSQIPVHRRVAGSSGLGAYGPVWGLVRAWDRRF